MAESAPKRRRILDPSTIVPVPVYSSQVSRGLQLKAPTFQEMKFTEEEAEDDELWPKALSNKKKPSVVELDSDDCEEEEEKKPQPANNSSRDIIMLRSPSPPPDSPIKRQSRKAKAKLNEVDRRLKAVNTLFSPIEDSPRRRRRRRSPRIQNSANNVIIIGPEEDDDLIMMSPELSRLASPIMAEREFPLKVRCRADLNRIAVLPSSPLSFVVETLSAIHGVPPSRLLLLREEAELSLDATVGELGLGIADIVECVVMAEEAEKTDILAGDSGDIIKVRLQGKDRGSTQEFSLHKDAPLSSVFEQYLSGLTGGAKKKVRFHFDGSKVSAHQTPAQLDMEDGDIIEVWA